MPGPDGAAGFGQLFDPVSSTYTYVLACARSGEAVVIDPVHGQRARDEALLRAAGWRPRWVLDTHLHADHVTGAEALRRVWPDTACTALGAPSDATGYQRALQDGDCLTFGHEALRVIATPGHTPGHMSFLWRGRVFTGDALLIGGCGRTDIQGGDAGRLYDAVTGRLFRLPGDTLVYPGHDYRGRRVSCIGDEHAHNPRFAGRSRAEFMALMAALDLPPPRAIDVALPANRRAGAPLPDAPAPLYSASE
ncbi:MBL fold metallo-hydrolase [Ideonella sp.]|uniref:MBL fold metallo-hydrolase n=1 Tax=Ideonella sp. TaxID=1929293 RepID=UPI0035B0DC0E